MVMKYSIGNLSVLCLKNFGYLKGVLWLNKSAILQREETKCIIYRFHDEKLLPTSPGGAVRVTIAKTLHKGLAIQSTTLEKYKDQYHPNGTYITFVSTYNTVSLIRG